MVDPALKVGDQLFQSEDQFEVSNDLEEKNLITESLANRASSSCNIP
jgi:hypothetical protein